MAPRADARAEQLHADSPTAARNNKKASTDDSAFSTSVRAPLNFFGSGAPIAAPPTTPPPFTVADIRAAIPKHCFERSALISGWHLFLDLVKVAALGYGATHIQTVEDARIRAALWVGYWLLQGWIMTGIWVIAHECGHQSFSPSKFINDTVGWFAHSALLVPYHSWRISHAKHHKNTCSVEHDEVFAPATRSEWADMTEETPLASAWGIFVMLTFGWPGYLAANFSGPAKYRGKSNSHFNPGSDLFKDVARQWWEVVVSDWGFFLAVAAIFAAGYVFGAQAVAAYYFIPYLVVNADLVLITYLQHTDTYIPHFREGEFDWLRGALSTVDRSYGWFLDACFHHISDTHVVHHLFHEMPWYHAQEATKHVRAVLGPYYLSDHTPVPAALWRSWTSCKFVEDEGNVCFYKPLGAPKETAGKKRA